MFRKKITTDCCTQKKTLLKILSISSDILEVFPKKKQIQFDKNQGCLLVLGKIPPGFLNVLQDSKSTCHWI